ncbi:MAG: sugar transferase [Thermoanaerobaculia bacterium]
MAISEIRPALSFRDRMLKRSFDLVVAAGGLLVTWPIILVAALAATIDTGMNGFFTQTRVGRHGRRFKVVKIRTMRSSSGYQTNVTSDLDPRITRLGRLFRKAKIDELPQLWNVLRGEMSFVGPRPDVPGFADALEGDDRIILELRPGITGPATLRFRDEERLLAQQPDPERFNREVVWVEKVRLNREYIENYRFSRDIRYVIETLFTRE